MAGIKYRATDGTIKDLEIISTGGGAIPPDLADTIEQHTQDIAGLETQTTQLTTAVGAINDSLPTKYSAINPPPYPVTSVNGKTGAVTIEGGGGITEAVRCDKVASGVYAYKGSLAANKIAFARVYGGPSGAPTRSITVIREVDEPEYTVEFEVFGIYADLSGDPITYYIDHADKLYLNFYVGGFV